MTIFSLGGKRVVVKTTSTYLFFYRRQGLSVEVNPSSHWWCLGLCTTTDEIDALRCAAEFVRDGDVVDQKSGTCADCGSLGLNGPRQYGYGVPQAYQLARYQGVATISGNTYSFSGIEWYGTPPV